MIQETLGQFQEIIVETEFLNVREIRNLIHYKSNHNSVTVIF